MTNKISSIKLALLGQGEFAKPSFDLVSKYYPIVTQAKADCLLVANYGKILSREEIDKPRYGAINIHGSILPKYRGSSPIQTALAKGDKQTGITIIKMDEKIDHGPILSSSALLIDQNDTTPTLRIKLGLLASQSIVKTLDNYFQNKIKSLVQDESLATYTKKIKFEDTQLDLKLSAQSLYNYYRAYKDEPGVYIKLENGQILKIIKAILINNKFVPEIVQKEGKKSLSYQDFLLGYRGPKLF